MKPEWNQWLEDVVEIAREAGEKIMQVYEGDFDVAHKDDRSPLTEADLASHRHIEAALERLTPDIPVLSEESDDIDYEIRRHWQTYWLIDPLDGTREFVKRNGEFTVNIALIHQHRSVMGVVYAPVTEDSFYAVTGSQAWHRKGAGEAIRIQCRTGFDIPVIAGSRSHANERMQAFLDQLEDYELISLGSSLKFCYIAMGRADLYVRLGPTSEWDTAAAHCIVTEAGGRVTTTDFEELEYNTKPSLLNPDFLVFCELRHTLSSYFDKKS